MPRGNEARGNTSRGNSLLGDPVAGMFRSDLKITVLLDEYSDVAMDIGEPLFFDSDTRIYITERASFNSDIKHIISEAINEKSDVVLRIFKPLHIAELDDVVIHVIPTEAVSEKNDLWLDIGEPHEFESDMELECVERANFLSDIKQIIAQPIEFFTDIELHIYTDPENPEVVKIAAIMERRWLPAQPEIIMVKMGDDNDRYRFMWTVATAEFNARQNLESAIKSLRLSYATGAALDWVADRVGEKRWQFYDDRVERFEADNCFRNRLFPYFVDRRGTLEALQNAVQPLHDCYGGFSSFYSYTIGHGWVLGVTGQTELGSATYLGGPLLNLNPLEHLVHADLWLLGVDGNSELGITTYLGDRERLGPFTFIIEVWNYKDDERWKELYLHTIDRFKAAGTVAIVIFRRGAVLRHQIIAGSGSATYTVNAVHLQGRTAIVTFNGVGQTPGTDYTLTNSGANTTIEFNATDPGAPAVGDSIVVYWADEVEE